ncbi:hypothetical protein E4T56_gene8851 [Termitomyces sp. T112]|nr:hypothetical protein E4T56_gene8851 [Termitomyces sp. T112]
MHVSRRRIGQCQLRILWPLPPDVPADPHGKKAGKVKVVEAEKAKDQKEFPHACTNSVEPAAGAVSAKRRPPEEIDRDAGSSVDGDGVNRLKLALEEGGMGVGAVGHIKMLASVPGVIERIYK